MVEATLTITHPLGLHARPAALLCITARRFKSTITVQNLSRPDTKPAVLSPWNLISQAVTQGQQVRVVATGEDAEAAIAALTELVNGNFGE